jgi:hypothetical protein
MNAYAHPIAVLGAGPVGLAAAAHLIARGLPLVVLEAGATVGANLETYRHVRLFSPWRYNVDRAARTLLLRSGWQAPDDEHLPTAGELIDAYLQPLARIDAMRPVLRLNHRVVQLARQGFDKVKSSGREHAPFVLRVHTPEGESELLASAVIDATGTWSQPNPLGANGLPAAGEAALAGSIFHGMPDVLGQAREHFAGKRVLVVGSGHSAAGSLIALAKLAEQAPSTRIIWALRGQNVGKVYGGGDADQLAARGLLGMRVRALTEAGKLELHTGFQLTGVARQPDGTLCVSGRGAQGQPALITGLGAIIGATGARPDLELTRELRVQLDPWLESTPALAPLIDPNLHSCGTVRPHGHRELAHPEPGYYSAGAKSYGRAPNFLMATGYEQVRSIVAALAGDLAAADEVRLELPETGVCSLRPRAPALADAVGASCCVPATRPDPVPAPTACAAAACDATDRPLAEAAEDAEAASACCGGPAADDTSACCATDALAKARGEQGCGCATAATRALPTPSLCCP